MFTLWRSYIKERCHYNFCTIMASTQVASCDREFLQEGNINLVLRKYLLTDQFVIKSFNLRPASDGLIGFLGEHFKLTITYALDGVISNVSLFVKSVPRGNQLRIDYIKDYNFFGRESTLYRDIFSQLKPEKDSDVWYGNCFLNLDHDLVLEDLNVKGYDILQVRTPMDKQHCLQALKSIARFHASSFILEESKSIRNNKVYRLQDDFYDIFGKKTCIMYNTEFKNGAKSCLIVAGESVRYGKSTTHFETIKTKWDQLFKEGVVSSSISKTLRNVICHLDLWNNNMMFRHNENGNPLQCILVDFQGTRLAPPAADIMSFVYMNLDKETRDKSTDELLLHYYNELTKKLKENGLAVGDILPWNTFRESCEYYRKWGLVHSLILFQYIFMDKNVASETLNDPENFLKLLFNSRGDDLVRKMKEDVVFCKRIMTNVDDFINLYIIKDH